MPGEQPAERRLAGARGPDDGDPLARLEIEPDPVQHVAARDVGVADVVRAQPVVLGLLAARRAVGRHVGDADEPGERGAADLHLVEPREQPVDRVGELLDVEHDRRHLADRGMPVGDEPAAPGERRDDGQDVGDVDGREPDRAQPERVPLRGVGVGEVGVDPARPLGREAERLDGAAAVDRLARGAGHRRVRRALPEVAGRRVAEVPPRPDDQDRRTDETGQRSDRADPDCGGDDEERRHARDRRLGDREPDRARERVDVGGRARDEVADPGPLDGRERQRQHAPHEVVAQLGEHPLGEHEGRPAGEEGEHRLGDEEDRQDRRRPGRSAPCRSPSAAPGRASPGAAARRAPWRRRARAGSRTPIIARRWRPASSRACLRISFVPAMGRRSVMRPLLG